MSIREERIRSFKKAIMANRRLSLDEKYQRLDTVDRIYGGHIRNAERTR